MSKGLKLTELLKAIMRRKHGSVCEKSIRKYEDALEH